VGATPPPTGPRRTHGAAIAATVVSLPAAKIPGAGMPGASQSVSATPPPVSATPPPVSATPPPQAMAVGPTPGPAPTPKPAAGGNFRETLWFKKGDVDQMVAEARARVEAARAKGIAVSEADAEVAAQVAAAAAAPEEAAGQLDERYVDDGTLTADDRKKFSLRSGATSTALPTVGGSMPGERMSDAEVMGEIGGKKKIVIIAIAVVVLALIGVVVVKTLKSKDVTKNAEAITPTTIPTTPAPPPEATPPPAPAEKAAPAAAEKAAPAEKPAPAAKAAAEPGAPRAAHSGGPKKHVVAKKAKGKKAHK
jgi:hypothetical protein